MSPRVLCSDDVSIVETPPGWDSAAAASGPPSGPVTLSTAERLHFSVVRILRRFGDTLRRITAQGKSELSNVLIDAGNEPRGALAVAIVLLAKL